LYVFLNKIFKNILRTLLTTFGEVGGWSNLLANQDWEKSYKSSYRLRSTPSLDLANNKLTSFSFLKNILCLLYEHHNLI